MAGPARVQQKLPAPVASGSGGRGSGALVANALRDAVAAPRSGDDLEWAKAGIGPGSGGRPLDRSTRSLMEGRFEHDFGRVRLHTNATAARSAQELGARAYTIGSDIAFAAQQYAPATTTGQRLLAHELAHVIQRAPGVARQKVGGQVVEDPAERAADRAATSIIVGREPLLTATTAAPSMSPATQLGPGWVTVNQLGIVRVVQEPVPVSIGALLRAAPTDDATVLRKLAQNAKVFVLAESKANRKVYVQTLEGGQRGFIADWLVWYRYPLPDPQAVLYYVAKEGLGLQELVENHPQYKSYDIRTGDDARSLVMAVLTANDQDPRTRGHVYINEQKLAEARDPGFFEGLKDLADEYRAVMRPILQSVELRHNEKIWLPGPAYVRSLQQTGLIPTRPEWKNAAIAVTKGIGGFLAGLMSGFVSAVADVFMDVYELVKTVISTVIDLITGDLLTQAQELYDQLDDLSPKQLLDLLVNAVTQAVGGMFNDFINRWTQNNLYEKWYFRGSVVGYVLAEVLMAIFTGGTATAVKLLSKLGKLGVKLAGILVKVMGRVDKALDAIPGRTKRDTPDVDRDAGSDRAKQLPLATALASTIAESHDRIDSPIPVLGASLLPLKLKYRWITAFRAIPTGPGEYRIVMIASPAHEIDQKYTTGAEEGTAAGAEKDISEPRGGDLSPRRQTEERGKAILESFEERSATPESTLEALRGTPGELAEYRVWKPPPGAPPRPGPRAAAKVRRAWLRGRLKLHVEGAIDRFAGEGLTEKQLDALKRHGGLERAFRGSRIDGFAKESVMLDPDLADVISAPDFIGDPDFIDSILPDWFDMTTRGEWTAHLQRYGRRYGAQHGKLLEVP